MQPPHRGQNDHAAPLGTPAGQQTPPALARGQEDAAAVDRLDLVKLFDGQLGRRAVGVDPGVGDHGVHQTKARLGGVIAGDDRGLVRHVHRHGQGLAARRLDLGDQSGQTVGPARRQNHPGPAARQDAGELGADARRSAGDQGHAALMGQLGHACFLSRADCQARVMALVRLRCSFSLSQTAASQTASMSTAIRPFRA
ncbi:hypothetical protein D3C85_1044020 [compost metagenome]